MGFTIKAFILREGSRLLFNLKSVFEKNKKIQDTGSQIKHTFYNKLLPKSGIEFFSDYFRIGSRYYTILCMTVDDGAMHDLSPFWRYNLIPNIHELNDEGANGISGISAELIEGYANRTKEWVESAKDRASWINKREVGDGLEGGASHAADLSVILNDLVIDGYADFCVKVLMSANSLSDLDIGVKRYQQAITNKIDLAGVHFIRHNGQQMDDYATILSSPSNMVSNPTVDLMATSSEYAGGYNLITQGITDIAGDYLGSTVGDINPTGMMFDMDNYDKLVIVAHNADAHMYQCGPENFDRGTTSSTLVGVRIAQSALVNNHRVVHFVLNAAKPQNIGEDLSDITTVVPLDYGAINPFEVFGTVETELSDYTSHKEKLKLMIHQISASAKGIKNELTSTDLNSTLSDIVEDFYKDKGMMVDNAKDNRDQVKVIGLKHGSYPTLKSFSVYLAQAYSAANRRNDIEKARSINRVAAAFKVMSVDNADLFDVVTTSAIDKTQNSSQIVYSFSKLLNRDSSRGVMMSQFINALHYATLSLSEGDVVMIHGTDLLTDLVKDYIDSVFELLKSRGIRVVLLYDNLEKCLRDTEFNHFRDADYKLLGGFNQALVDDYTDITHTELPNNVGATLVKFANGEYGNIIYYLSRKMDSVLFALSMMLGKRKGGLLSENPKGLSESSLQ